MGMAMIVSDLHGFAMMTGVTKILVHVFIFGTIKIVGIVILVIYQQATLWLNGSLWSIFPSLGRGQ